MKFADQQFDGGRAANRRGHDTDLTAVDVIGDDRGTIFEQWPWLRDHPAMWWLWHRDVEVERVRRTMARCRSQQDFPRKC